MKIKPALIAVALFAFNASIGASFAQEDANARMDAIKGRSMALQPKIVGGDEARPDRWPFAVAITFTRPDGSLFQYCGGTQITGQWIVTAAHCDVRKGDIAVIGRHDLTTSDGMQIEVDEVKNHEDYDPRTNDSDIALVKLAESVDGDTVALTDADDSFAGPGDDSTVIGWGLLSEGGQASNTLQEVTVPVLSNTGCQEAYAGTGITISENMICAGSLGKDSCQGDSGGGLFVTDPDQRTDQLTGVVSFGIGCAQPRFFGVYTRVSKFLNWINGHIGM